MQMLHCQITCMYKVRVVKYKPYNVDTQKHLYYNVALQAAFESEKSGPSAAVGGGGVSRTPPNSSPHGNDHADLQPFKNPQWIQKLR